MTAARCVDCGFTDPDTEIVFQHCMSGCSQRSTAAPRGVRGSAVGTAATRTVSVGPPASRMSAGSGALHQARGPGSEHSHHWFQYDAGRVCTGCRAREEW